MATPANAIRGLTVQLDDDPPLRLKLDDGRRAFVFANAGPDVAMPDPQSVQQLFRTLLDTRAESFVAAPPSDEQPIAAIEILRSANRKERLTVYPGETDGSLRVVREDEPVAAVISRETLAPIMEGRPYLLPVD
jgi:hypothetical protein